jgi:cytochrome c oxidase subunit IV
MSTEHIASPKLYIGVFVALLFLTALTTGMAYVDLGAWNTVVALAIAFCKASLVVLFFMHLKWGTGTMKTVAVVAIAWLALLIVLTNVDNLTRDWLGTPQPLETSMVTRPQNPPAATPARRP